MADFCKACSIDLFGEDFMDHEGKGELPKDEGWHVICEGCGFILVNNAGECIRCDLMKGKAGHDGIPME
jgi:hypothetical protein